MGNRSEDVVNVNSQFVPTRKIFVVVANRHYEEKRKIPRFSGFADIPEVDADLINVKNGLSGLGASIMDIRLFHDASRDDFTQIFRGLNNELYQNNSQGEKTAVFVYYAGHGM